MSEPLHWVMASSEATGVDDGAGRLLTFTIHDFRDTGEQSGWKWVAEFMRDQGGRWLVARGSGYPDPISARAAAEYWLSVTREQNALRAALEAEGQS